MDTILPTTLVGSYPQPDWLIDRAKLAGRFPPRVRAKELWRIAPERLEQAQDDATLLAIRDQERAGLDIITDGEMRRESYSNRALRRHWTALISTTPVRRWIVVDIRIPCRVLSAGSGGAVRSRSAM